MTLRPNAAQEAADAIKRRRQVTRDLRLIAELVEDGLPEPIGITPTRSGHRTVVQVWHTDLADWLIYFDEPTPTWERDKFDGETVRLDVDHGLTLTAFRRSVAEVTC